MTHKEPYHNSYENENSLWIIKPGIQSVVRSWGLKNADHPYFDKQKKDLSRLLQVNNGVPFNAPITY